MRPHVDKVLSGEYDLPPTIELIQPPRLVIDIGANVGAFTAWARAQWPECSVLAYEPLPANQVYFENNHGQDRKVDLTHRAVMNKGCSVRLRSGLNNCGENSVYDIGEQSEDFVDVQAVSARWLPAGDFIKIDAEGAEVEILKGLDLSDAEVIAYEWHGQDRRRECQHIMVERTSMVCVREHDESAERGVCVWVLPSAVREVAVPNSSLPRLFLAVPIYGGVDPHFYTSMLALMTAADRPYHLRVRDYIGDSLVCRARNRLVADFLASDSTHLFFIDSDLIFSAEHVARIAAHAGRGVPIVAGLYPKKQRELGWVCNVLEPCPGIDEHDLQPVKYAGTGFLCIAREVFEKMKLNYSEARYDPDDGDGVEGSLWDFFPVGIRECPETGRRRYLSEDWWFCQRALDLGYQVMIDTRIVCKHVGQFIYPFDSQESFSEKLK